MTKKIFSSFLMATALTSASFAQEPALDGNSSSVSAKPTAKTSSWVVDKAVAVAPYVTVVTGAFALAKKYMAEKTFNDMVYGRTPAILGYDIVSKSQNGIMWPALICGAAAATWAWSWYTNKNSSKANNTANVDNEQMQANRILNA